MRKPKSQTTAIDKPKKGYRLPFIVVTLLVFLVSLGLLTLMQSNHFISTRHYFADQYADLIQTYDNFALKSKNTLVALTHFMQREDDFEALTTENRELMKWRHIAMKLYAENESLKKHLQFVPEGRLDFITARCLSFSQDAYKTAVLNVGTNHSVKKGDAVLAKKGLIGRVIEVTDKTAKVLLIHDPLSRVPVTVEGKDISALVAGDYTGKLKLLYVAHDSSLTVGDRLMTSNEGGVFPSNFLVGTVVKIEEDAIEVASAENLNAMDFMIVLRLPAREEQLDGQQP